MVLIELSHVSRGLKLWKLLRSQFIDSLKGMVYAVMASDLVTRPGQIRRLTGRELLGTTVRLSCLATSERR